MSAKSRLVTLAQFLVKIQHMYTIRETPIVEKAIAELVELGHVYKIWFGGWLSKGLLAQNLTKRT